MIALFAQPTRVGRGGDAALDYVVQQSILESEVEVIIKVGGRDLNTVMQALQKASACKEKDVTVCYRNCTLAEKQQVEAELAALGFNVVKLDVTKP